MKRIGSEGGQQTAAGRPGQAGHAHLVRTCCRVLDLLGDHVPNHDLNGRVVNKIGEMGEIDQP